MQESAILVGALDSLSGIVLRPFLFIIFQIILGADIFRTTKLNCTFEFEHLHEEIVFLPEKVCDADYGVNINEEDLELSEFDGPFMPITKEFEVDCWTDAIRAPDLENARSDVMVIIRINGAPGF